MVAMTLPTRGLLPGSPSNLKGIFVSRSRNIKPGFFKNDQLAECEPLARLLFAGLWCEADREGRLEDRPKRLKADCLPYDECDVDKLLNQLAGRGFIVRYVIEGIGYISIPEFLKHQNPHRKESASTIPAQDKDSPRHVPAPEIPEQAGLIPDSPFLIPDSLVKATVQPSVALRSTAVHFERFWAAYPNKKGKKDAERHWRREGCDQVADDLIAHIQLMQSQDDDWRRGFAPMGSTYLNGRRWEDVPKAAPRHQLSKTAQGLITLQEMGNGLDGSGNQNGFPEIDMPRLGSPARFGTFGGNGNGVG